MNSCGYFAKLEHDQTGLTKKIESGGGGGGGVDIHGFTFSHDAELVQLSRRRETFMPVPRYWKVGFPSSLKKKLH